MDTTIDSMTEILWDTVIIGGGAAGLSAGIVLARAQFATLVVDGGKPRNGPAAHMHGYLSRDGMAPGAFLTTGRAELARYGGTLTSATVTEARRHPDGGFALRLDNGRTVHARSVLVATGLTDELPDIPGLAARWASQVHHCPHCHGYEVRGHEIAVIGSAMGQVSKHLAALLRRYSRSVTFCLNGIDSSVAERRRLAAYGVTLVDAKVTQVVAGASDRVRVELDNGQTLECQTIFLAPRPVPHDEVLTMLGAGTDPHTGLVLVDGNGATDIPGVWAAGNVVNPRAQVVAAAGAGSAAGINIAAWLLEAELSAAVRRDGSESEGGN